MPVTIQDVDPNTGQVGTPVEITGDGFTNSLDTHVFFNGTPARAEVHDAEYLKTSVPPGATSGLISVTSSNGTGVSPTPFTVQTGTARITSFTPKSGPKGIQVTINGSGFTNATNVFFNTAKATTWVKSSDTKIVATVPTSATSGFIHVQVPGFSAQSPSTFTVTGQQKLRRYDEVTIEQATPIEAAIIAAWNAMFQAGPDNLPDFITTNYGSFTVPSVTNQDVNSVDICFVPDSYDTPVGSADPSLNLTSMQFSGLGNMAQGGTPTFQSNDTVVILPTNVSNISVSGSFDMNQPCCTPALFWCISSPPAEATGTFTYSMPSSTLNITLAINAGPPLTASVKSLSFDFTASPSVSIPDPDPSWLSWLNAFSGYIVTSDGIKSALSSATQNAIQGTALASQLTTIFNKVLSTTAAGAAVPAGKV